MLDSTSEIISKNDHKSKPVLWAHQETAKNLALKTDGFALFMDLGVGKTATSIHILIELFKRHKRMLPTLILCPPVVIRSWELQFSIHSDIDRSKIISLTGSGAWRLKRFLSSDPDSIFITNYESLNIKPLLAAFLKQPPEVLICDEIHKCKDIKAKRTKACIKLADTAKYRYGLTGSPILNSPMDLYSQFRILDLGKTFGKSFFVFRDEYFQDANRGMGLKHFPNWKIKPGALEKITERIKERSFIVKKEECLSLPPLVRKVIEVELSPEQKRHYDGMKKDLITYIGSDACVAKIALTRSLRLLQIVSGFITVEGVNGTDRKDLEINQSRIAAVRQLLTDIPQNEKVIIWSTFKANYRALTALCTEMGITFKTITGDDTLVAKNEAVADFQDPKGCRVIIANPGAGGIGISLVAASYMIYYSRGFSLEHDIQSESRNHRSGSEQHAKITRIDIITPNTIDEFVAKRLFQKQALSDTILLNYLREGF